jgi:hypothetical protein
MGVWRTLFVPLPCACSCSRGGEAGGSMTFSGGATSGVFFGRLTEHSVKTQVESRHGTPNLGRPVNSVRPARATVLT